MASKPRDMSVLRHMILAASVLALSGDLAIKWHKFGYARWAVKPNGILCFSLNRAPILEPQLWN